MILLRNKMIRVSAPIHGGSPVFKHDSIGLSTSIKGSGQQNGKQQWLRKQLYKCNGHPVVDNNTSQSYHQSSPSPNRTHHSAQKNPRYSPNPKSSNTQRSLPFNKQDVQFNLSKFEFDLKVEGLELNLFAGSKSCVTPSPTELPKPPRNWMNFSMASPSKPSSREVASSSPHLDLTHDSAVLAVGTEKEHLLKLKKLSI